MTRPDHPTLVPARLDGAALLDAADRAAALARPWRELALLSAACGASVEDLARLPIGRRDRLLLELRARTFGDRLECETSCPACGMRLELGLSAAALSGPEADRLPDHFEVTIGETSVTCRLPNSTDLAACADATDSPEDALLGRCLVRMPANGRPLGRDARDAIAKGVASLDPIADLQLDLRCPECGHAWVSSFDPAAFVLAEVDAYADRLLDEVCVLARAYGWREADVLAMSADRRRQYLERVRQ